MFFEEIASYYICTFSVFYNPRPSLFESLVISWEERGTQIEEFFLGSHFC